jgi:hypothetical protein
MVFMELDNCIRRRRMVFCVSRERIGERGKRANAEIVYQSLTKEFVIRHLEAEKAAGKQIFPAFAGLEMMNEEGKETDKSKLLKSETE